MTFFRLHFKKIILALCLLAGPWFLYQRPLLSESRPVAWYSRLVTWTFFPFLKATDSLKTAAKQTLSRYLFLVHTERENEELKKKIAAAEVEQIYFRSLEKENERLGSLVDFQKKLPFKTTAARVLAHPPMGEFQILILDRGSHDGVERGDPVISPEGFVGRVIELGEKSSKVLLMTDPTSVVDARVVRTAARGLIVGKGVTIVLDREMFIGAFEFWDKNAQVQEGDLLVTSGLDGASPEDIPIGKVQSVKKDPYQVFQKGSVIPAVDPQKLREVLVLTGYETSPAL